ncbi:MAG: tryptophan--tRNA ligase [Patescibacteria group bacterium]
MKSILTLQRIRQAHRKQAQGENAKKRILTGDRPTYDSFHLGNYVGSLANRVKLQDEYETYILVADLHALTTHYEKTADLEKNIRGLMLGYLSVGLDPNKVTFILQSKELEKMELAYILATLTFRPVLERQPALKEKLDQGEQDTLALYEYPVLMAADILLPKANLVPVGKDQKAHVELARDLAEKFNKLYGEVFPLPEPLIGDVPTLSGTDGQAKMGKSLNNAIFLTDSAEVVEKKVMSMYTDPKRIHPTDPGTVEGNPVFIYLDAFSVQSDKGEVQSLKERYRKGQVGDIEVKKYLVKVLNNFLDPIRKRRAEFEKQPELVDRILKEGTEKARKEAQKTLDAVKKAMKIDYYD